MDRCLSNNEPHLKSYRDHDDAEYSVSSPWDALQLPKSDTDDSDYWSLSPRRCPGDSRRRSSTPYSDTSSVAAMSPDPCDARSRSSLYRPPLSPSTPDDDGTNPVESLYNLNLTETMRSGRSQGSNASSHRSSASSAVSWDSNRSGDSGSAAIPSFKSFALRYVSRPDPVTSSTRSGGGTFPRGIGVFGSIREERGNIESPDGGGADGSSSGGRFKRTQTQASHQSRRLAEMAISEEQAADVVALGEMIGGRRVRIPFMQSKKSTGSGKKKTPSIVQQLLALRGSRTLPRGALGDTMATAPSASGLGGQTSDVDRNSLFAALQLFKGTSLEEALLPPCDYADNSPPSLAPNDSNWHNDCVMPPPATTDVPRHNYNASPTPSLSDVEMPSKPPSRDSSFRGEDDLGSGDIAAVMNSMGSEPAVGAWPFESAAIGAASQLDGSRPSTTVGFTPISACASHSPATSTCCTNHSATCAAKKDTQATTNPIRCDANCELPVKGSAASTKMAPGANVDSKKRVYGCTVPDCGKVYTKSSHLKSHLRSHTGKLSMWQTTVVILWLASSAAYAERERERASE